VTFKFKTELIKIFDFKLLLCCESCIRSFGWFPGIWILCVDVLEHCLFHLHSSFEQEE